MTEAPLISICIPAYKRTTFLDRLLNSISLQTFKDFEIIMTDDSPDDAVRDLCRQYANRISIDYYRNPLPLGTPENWNEGIRKARGEWIKIMHDDDWFADEKSLHGYAECISLNPSASFIFSAYRNVYLELNKSKEVYLNSFRYKALLKNPVTLFSSNIIGPPSVVIHKRENKILYDNNVKWVVDIDFYIRWLANNNTQAIYLKKVLVNVGIGKEQVTQDCFRLRKVEIPENFYLLNKVGHSCLKNILVYDAWWRSMRNLEIKNIDDIVNSGYNGNIPKPIRSMIDWQSIIPHSLLKIGLISKSLMLVNYTFNLKRLSP